MVTDNPYAIPEHLPSRASVAPPVNENSLLVIAREVFLVWEKLRIVYIATLGSITILLVGMSGSLNVGLVALIIFGAVVANVLYFAGPIIDTYIRWLGYRKNWPRWLMFVMGTIASMVTAIGVLATELLPGMM